MGTGWLSATASVTQLQRMQLVLAFPNKRICGRIWVSRGTSEFTVILVWSEGPVHSY